MTHTVRVHRSEASDTPAAIRVALKRAPINYGLDRTHVGGRGWTFIFVQRGSAR